MSRFGPILKYFVKLEAPKQRQPSLNAFSLMMSSFLCEECGMWRLVYAKRKLTKVEASKLNAALDGLSFSCGSPLQDLDLEDCIQSEVYVQDLQCGEPVEPLYYAANFQDICVYCCEEVTRDSMTQEYYPQCEDCQDKQKILKKKN